ncbi:glycosyltransferase [Acinetobacter terrae]|uniref:glycosyltransferase n=1 Tax=Acinetobacter terrae TaxID=2731247 RepID=UPI00148F5D5C|nr:glycosyltransferase [Acinetobacter terrae]
MTVSSTSDKYKKKYNMKRILFIVDDLGKGGAEKITLELAHTLAKNGHLVTLAVLNSGKNTLIVDSSIEYIDLNINPKFAFGKLWKFKELSKKEQKTVSLLINEKNFDLIILGFHNGYYLGKYLTQKKNVWYWIHGELIEYRPTKSFFKRVKENFRQIKNQYKFRKLFTHKNLITVNRDLQNKYQFLLPQSKVIHIANGVTIQSGCYSKLEKKWDVIFVGRLTSIKQIDHAILAFSKSGLSGKMAIIGDGNESDKAKLIALCEKLNIIERIDFLGWINDPYPLIAQASCLVMSSNYESFGLVIAESLCLDIPVVAYNCSQGVADILSLQTDMQSYLVEKQNINQLAQKLAQCVQSPYPILTSTKKKLSIQNTAKQFIQLIE